MAGFELTKAQKQVVEAQNCSLLVAAAAGSGKTAVLVKRIIDRISSGATSVDRLLIVTFTNAAAAEMKERIGNALKSEIEKNPENMLFKEQWALLSEAKISTIDSFCNMIVRENFQTLGIDPAFSVTDPAENELIKADVLEEIFEEEYEAAEEDFMKLVSAYGEYKDDTPVRKLVIKLFDFADNEPRPELWLKGCLKDYDDPTHNELEEDIVHEARRILKDTLRLCEYCIDICKGGVGCPSALAFFEKELISLQQLEDSITDFNSCFTGFSGFKLEPFGGARKISDEEKAVKEKAKAVRDSYKKDLEAFKTRYFGVSAEKAHEVYMLTRPAVSALVRVTDKFRERLWETKKEKCSFSFSDIEHMALKILCVRNEEGDEEPSEVAKALAFRFDEIMIDEYQDSSYIQEYMLKSISGEFGDRIPNLFMVGDVKQSIYSFRQARPELFEKKYREFKDEGTHRKIDLSENFRSRKSVLDAVNVLLAPLMKRDMTEIEYDGAAALHFGSKVYKDDDPKKPVYDTELVLIDKSIAGKEPGEEPDEDEEPEDSLSEGETTFVEREALTVARKIREMLDSGFTVSDGVTEDGEKKTRPVGPGDFAILTRNAKFTTEIFVKALDKMNIYSAAEKGTGFFNAVEIRKTLAFLRVVDNPFDDISFTAALYSPFGCFTASDLAELKIRYGKKMLYDCVKAALEEEEKTEDALMGKIRDFAKLLFDMRKLNETLTVHELIEAFYERSDYKNMVTLMPGGESRRGNLDMLISLAERYEKSSFAGLHDFIRYIDRLIEKDKDFGEAEAETDDEAVTVTTMHKSKGLEFPVVFVCLTTKEFNLTDSKSNVMIDRDRGIGANQVDRKKRVKRKTIKQCFLQDTIKQKELSEELRVLYVALTRAKEKLFIMASVDDPVNIAKKWHNTLLVNESPTYTDLKGYKTFMDFMGPTLFSEISEEEIEGLANGKLLRTSVTRHAGNESYTAGFGISLVRYDEESAGKLAEGIRGTESEKGPAVSEKSFTDEPGVREEIMAQRAFIYPGLEKANAPMRVSVSALKHIEIENLMSSEEQEEGESPLMPGVPDEGEKKEKKKKSAKEEVSAGALRGTLYHEVFEKLRYDGTYSNKEEAEASIKKDVDGLIREGFLEKDILKTVSVKDLAVFCMTDIGKAMIKAQNEGKLHREQPFVYGLSPEDYRFYSKTEGETGTVMVQGIIDAYIDKGDNIVLIDYKTDKVTKDAEEELKARYHVQLDLYAKALENLTGKPVSQKVIYSVTAGKDIYL